MDNWRTLSNKVGNFGGLGIGKNYFVKPKLLGKVGKRL